MNYASSRWCFDELVMIMDCKRNGDYIVLPVFYDVDPPEVAVALLDHEKCLKKEMERVSEGLL